MYHHINTDNPSEQAYDTARYRIKDRDIHRAVGEGGKQRRLQGEYGYRRVGEVDVPYRLNGDIVLFFGTEKVVNRHYDFEKRVGGGGVDEQAFVLKGFVVENHLRDCRRQRGVDDDEQYAAVAVRFHTRVREVLVGLFAFVFMIEQYAPFHQRQNNIVCGERTKPY